MVILLANVVTSLLDRTILVVMATLLLAATTVTTPTMAMETQPRYNCHIIGPLFVFSSHRKVHFSLLGIICD